MKMPFWPNPKGYRDIDLGLKRVYDLLKRLDNPQEKIPPTIHIAGTNGKGSTLAFLKTIFCEAGYLVHSYTSPHLVSFNERIVLAGEKISDDFLNKCLQSCKEAAERHPKIEVTFFEGITVAAFLAFSKVKADILLLETGMGGRLDATNVIKKNLLSIITSIDFDHTEFLGRTLDKIAFEKAGIIKKNCPVIIGKQKLSALKVIENQAFKLNSAVKIFGKNFTTQNKIKKINWIYQSDFNCDIDFPLPSLQGRHQIENASLAITAALSQKKLPITIEQIKLSLQKTFWPARLQKINNGKLKKILPDNYDLILDGSHNIQGATTIKKFLKSQKYKKKFIIFSMIQDKNCEGFLKKIKDEFDELICLEIPNETKSRKKEEIFKIAQKLKIKSITANNFRESLEKISQKKIHDQSLVLICGSLYLAGSFLEQNQ